jgi:ATP-dependent protease Clp ATPase subunit
MWFSRLRCSFCRRSDTQVAQLVAGARGYICDKCAYETIRILESTPPAETTTGARAAVSPQDVPDWNRTWHFATAIE